MNTYIRSLSKNQVSYEELKAKWPVKTGHLSELIPKAPLNKLTDTLYLSYKYFDHKIIENKHLYTFYETCYDNVIVSFTRTTQSFWFSVLFKDFDGTVYNFTIHEKNSFKNYVIEQTPGKLTYLDVPFANLHSVPRLKEILGVDGELDFSNNQFYFTRFAERFPILFHELPPIKQSIGNIFKVIDSHIVGIQYVDIEYENV